LYTSRSWAGISSMPCTEPCAARMRFFIDGPHSPRSVRSLSKCGLTIANSPDVTRRV